MFLGFCIIFGSTAIFMGCCIFARSFGDKALALREHTAALRAQTEADRAIFNLTAPTQSNETPEGI